MANNIEWARLTSGFSDTIEVEFAEPEEIQDPFGSVNDLPALFFGDGICIEDTKAHWLEFAEKLLVAAMLLPDDEPDEE